MKFSRGEGERRLSAMGDHGRTGLDHVLLGSVAKRVVVCPVPGADGARGRLGRRGLDFG